MDSLFQLCERELKQSDSLIQLYKGGQEPRNSLQQQTVSFFVVNKGMASMPNATVLDQDQASVMQPQNGTMAVMINQTPIQMTLDRSHNWSGIPSTVYFPPVIAPNGGSAPFTHLRGGQYGSVAGVQYSGVNTYGVLCAWILAWYAPADNTAPILPPNRVYVTCGFQSDIDAISWHQIDLNLDVSPTNVSFSDTASKTYVYANIHDLTPSTATLSATFGAT